MKRTPPGSPPTTAASTPQRPASHREEIAQLEEDLKDLGQLADEMLAIAVAGLLLAVFAWFAPAPIAAWTAPLPVWRNETLLAALGVAGALIYGGVLLAGLKVLGVRLSRR